MKHHDQTTHKMDDDDDYDDDDTSVMSLEIASGDIGVLQDMTTAPELNGKIVKVKHESSNREGQWLVQLHETGKKLVVDSENLFTAAFH